jgi:hypothetical protein
VFVPDLPLVSLISKLFELLCGLETKPEVYLIMRHYVGGLWLIWKVSRSLSQDADRTSNTSQHETNPVERVAAEKEAREFLKQPVSVKHVGYIVKQTPGPLMYPVVNAILKWSTRNSLPVWLRSENRLGGCANLQSASLNSESQLFDIFLPTPAATPPSRLFQKELSVYLKRLEYHQKHDHHHRDHFVPMGGAHNRVI